MTLEVSPIHESFGVRVGGLDPRQELTPALVAELRALVDKHHLLLLHTAETLKPLEQAKFTEYFGELESLKGIVHFEGISTVFRTTNRPNDKGIVNAGSEGWHNDGPYRAIPTDLICYQMVEIPSVGGHTLFANGHTAFETLPEELKKKLDGAWAVHGYGWNSLAAYKLVRNHPRTGRKALYASLNFTDTTVDQSAPGTQIIIGWEPEEARRVFDELIAHLQKPALMYRHKWQAGDVLLTDNASLLHLAEIVEPKYPRALHRVSVVGKADLRFQHMIRSVGSRA